MPLLHLGTQRVVSEQHRRLLKALRTKIERPIAFRVEEQASLVLVWIDGFARVDREGSPLSVAGRAGARRRVCDGTNDSHVEHRIPERHITTWRIATRPMAARKKNANATAADRSAVLVALPRKDQLRLHSP